MDLQEYLQERYTLETALSYHREIGMYLINNTKAEEYTYSDIVGYLGVLRLRYDNASTLSRILASIKVYYAYLCYMGKRADNPAKSIHLRDRRPRDVQLQDLFTEQELEYLLDCKKERYMALEYRNRVLISLLIYQGLKPIEIAHITCEDIHLEHGQIYIKASPKTSSRTLGLKANQILLFKRYLEQVRVKLLGDEISEYFIIGHRGHPMSGADITKHIHRHYNIYLPRKVTPQTIRQSVIANLLKKNHDLHLVQRFAGHRYPSATERYRDENITALQTALEQYHPIK